MALRGIRGAITVANNAKEEIVAATKELLQKLQAANELEINEIASIIFSATGDLNAEFPAVAARELGWNDTPLLCARELEVPGSLAKCVRVLILVNTEQEQTEIHHIYLRDAVNLRR